MAREINLVPDVKGEMIKALKMRNFILFVCIIVAAASVGVTVVFGLIMGGQQLARDGKKQSIEELSSKLNSYSELGQTLTIKNQVEDISAISDNKQVFTRTFNLLSAILPTGLDTIRISELRVNLSGDEETSQPTLNFDAQANAGKEPYIDYNVLDSFKKSMQFMHYDYGNYVDKDGNTIPSYCMIEKGVDGAMLRDEKNNYYAYWTLKEDGCLASDVKAEDYTTEDFNGEKVVKIWRTPQYKTWYKANSDKTNMTLDGTITGVPHFESQCITYTGDDSSDKNNPKWSNDNQCNLITRGDSTANSIVIIESSNGRDANEELVLRFTATIYVNPEFYKFNNHHMIALAPSGRVNVTDSFVQIQSMFEQRASDCEEGDTSCESTVNSGGDETNTNNNNQTNGGS